MLVKNSTCVFIIIIYYNIPLQDINKYHYWAIYSLVFSFESCVSMG